MRDHYDVGALRSRFPALARLHRGKPVAYFDGPGGTQVPREVVEAMTRYLYDRNANTHWNYPSSAETDADLLAARASFAEFLGCRPTEVVFGANMTTLTMHLARALGAGFGPGDELVVTELDHQANIAPWVRLEKERGVAIRRVPFASETCTLDEDAFVGALSERTRLVALGAASNAVGTKNDVARWVGAARELGALTFVDAVHFAQHDLVDVEALGCDFLACSPYKFHGPHVGVLFGREELLAGLDVPRLPPSPDTAPERIETGTLNHEGIVGAAAAVDFLAGVAPGACSSLRARLEASFDAMHAHLEPLFARLWAGLGEIPGVQRFGPPPGAPRTPTIGFRVEGIQSNVVCARLAEEHALFLSDGDFYASTVVAGLGLPPDGLVRAGLACTTTEDEVERLLEGVRALAS